MRNIMIIMILLVLTSISFSQKTYFVAKDGTGNFSTITQVNSASLNPGDIVSFKSGQQFSNATLNCKKGVTYNTYGGSTQAVIGDSIGTDTCSVLINYKEDVTLDNLKVYGSANSSSSNANAIEIYSYLNPSNPGSANKINITIQNCTIVGGAKSTETRSYGIFCDGGIKGLNILDNEISFFSKCIYITNAYETLVSGNTIHDGFFYNPPKGIYGKSIQDGGMCIELWGSKGKVGDSSLVWDANYTVVISNNEIYNWERQGMGTTTCSKLLIEHNEFHDNLDERIYHGAIDHGGQVIKIDDWSAGYKLVFPGAVGSIFRYNKIHNVGRHQESLKYTNIGTTKWESDGSVYLQKDYCVVDPTYGCGGYSILSVIGGSGMDCKIYGNLMYDCSAIAFSRSMLYGKDARRTSLKNEIYNNTFWNVGYDPGYYAGSGAFGGATAIKINDRQSRTYVRNNIIYMSNNKGSAIRLSHSPLYEGNNLVFIGTTVNTAEFNNSTPPVAISLGIYGATRTQIGDVSSFGVSLSDSSNYFVDPANHDFRLKAGSPAIDAGYDLGNDNNGNKISGRGYTSGKVDIGAFEYDGGSSQSSPNGLKVLLEAPFENGKMKTTLNSSNLLPMSQPYNVSPWNINGDIIISSTSENYVDWILVQVRSDLTNTIYSKVGILTEDGTVLNPNGSSFSFSNLPSGEYYIVIKHRNHLSIMSAQKILIEKNKSVEYDFTDSQSKAFGENAMAKLSDGRYAMLAGDGDANGVVNVLDFGTVANNILYRGYTQGDIDMNGTVNILDYSKINRNLLKVSNVPN